MEWKVTNAKLFDVNTVTILFLLFIFTFFFWIHFHPSIYLLCVVVAGTVYSCMCVFFHSCLIRAGLKYRSKGMPKFIRQITHQFSSKCDGLSISAEHTVDSEAFFFHFYSLLFLFFDFLWSGLWHLPDRQVKWKKKKNWGEWQQANVLRSGVTIWCKEKKIHKRKMCGRLANAILYNTWCTRCGREREKESESERETYTFTPLIHKHRTKQ